MLFIFNVLEVFKGEVYARSCFLILDIFILFFANSHKFSFLLGKENFKLSFC